LLLAGLAAPAAGQGAGPGPTTTTTTQTATTQDEVVLQGDTTPRPALPTIYGDTGVWFVPTAATLPKGKWSFSLFRANWDNRQGLTDVNEIGFTGAVGVGNRVELFGSWRVVRLRRAVRNPTFIGTDSLTLGGIDQAFPFLRRGWSKTLGAPIIVGGKVAVLSEAGGDLMSLGPRVAMEFGGVEWAGTNAIITHADLVASKEIRKAVELTAAVGGVLRQNSDDFNEKNGVGWGIGAILGSRSRFRGLAEYVGEWATADNLVVTHPPYVAEDFSVAPVFSNIPDQSHIKFGGVFQAKGGAFVYGGLNFSQHAGDRTIGGTEMHNQAWGFDVRVGWHPGVTPPRERVHVIKETTTVTNTVTQPVPAAPAPAPPPNRSPNVTASCNPCSVEPGATTNLTATGTDPDGDPLTFAWTAPAGTFNNPNAANTVWTAPNQPGNVTATVTARDSRGATSTGSVGIQVVRRETLMFEDVHFDFDKYNLKPEALKILDDAIMKLQANPDLNVTIEGHCDSIGTIEYNLALGERRANAVREYLATRGIAMGRLRTVSYGEERPIADNNTAEGRALNRRVHLAVIIQ